MPYIGNQPGTGVRSRFIYTATASQTTFSGADDNSKTLKYADSAYVDVFLNGVCLVPGTDYTASTKTSIVLTQAASLSDTLEVIAYDIASMADTVSKADGGTFDGNVTFADGADIITASKGTDNVRIGENAGDSIASGGDNNVAIGKDAGTAISTGDLNVAVGSNALKTISTHSNNTAVGAFALDAGTGNSNVAIGSGALGNASYAADNNIGIGKDALNSNTTGDSNVAVGHQSLNTNSTAGNNTAVGYQAGYSTSTGDSNTFLGQQAGYATVGNRNTYVGRFAGNESNLAATQQNTFLGCFSGRYVTSGAKNTIIGGFDGNVNGLDMRTSSNNIIVSDGDGYPLVNVHANYLRVAQNQSLSDIADHSSGIFRSERGSMTASADADDFKTSGFYRFDQNAANLPATNTFFAMVIFGNSGNVVTQIAVQLQATTSYVRSFNSAWSSWARLDT